MYGFLACQPRAVQIGELHPHGSSCENLVSAPRPKRQSSLVLNFFMRRIQPILYRKISIYSDDNAERLIYSLTCKPEKVLYLFLSMSILPSITSRLLRCCPLLVSLVLYGGIGPSKHHMVLQALNSLPHLKFLFVDLSHLYKGASCISLTPPCFTVSHTWT